MTRSKLFSSVRVVAVAALLILQSQALAAQGPSTATTPASLFTSPSSTGDFMMQQQSPKSAGTAGLLSLLITGGGQIYNEEALKGGLMLAGSVLFAVVAIDGIDEYDCDADETCWSWMLPVGASGFVALKIWSILDATAGARRYNEAHGLAGVTVRPDLALTVVGRQLGLGLVKLQF